MQLLYNSDSFAVVQFDVPGADMPNADAIGSGQDSVAAAQTGQAPVVQALSASGIEIVDKLARREVYIQGALAERFIEGVKTLAATQPSEDQFDDYIAGFTSAAQQPLVLH